MNASDTNSNNEGITNASETPARSTTPDRRRRSTQTISSQQYDLEIMDVPRLADMTSGTSYSSRHAAGSTAVQEKPFQRGELRRSIESASSVDWGGNGDRADTSNEYVEFGRHIIGGEAAAAGSGFGVPVGAGGTLRRSSDSSDLHYGNDAQSISTSKSSVMLEADHFDVPHNRDSMIMSLAISSSGAPAFGGLGGKGGRGLLSRGVGLENPGGGGFVSDDESLGSKNSRSSKGSKSSKSSSKGSNTEKVGRGKLSDAETRRDSWAAQTLRESLKSNHDIFSWGAPPATSTIASGEGNVNTNKNKFTAKPVSEKNSDRRGSFSMPTFSKTKSDRRGSDTFENLWSDNPDGNFSDLDNLGDDDLVEHSLDDSDNMDIYGRGKAIEGQHSQCIKLTKSESGRVAFMKRMGTSSSSSSTLHMGNTSRSVDTSTRFWGKRQKKRCQYFFQRHKRKFLLCCASTLAFIVSVLAVALMIPVWVTSGVREESGEVGGAISGVKEDSRSDGGKYDGQDMKVSDSQNTSSTAILSSNDFFKPPPHNLQFLCSHETLLKENGYDTCLSACLPSRCCLLSPGEQYKVWASSTDGTNTRITAIPNNNDLELGSIITSCFQEYPDHCMRYHQECSVLNVQALLPQKPPTSMEVSLMSEVEKLELAERIIRACSTLTSDEGNGECQMYCAEKECCFADPEEVEEQQTTFESRGDQSVGGGSRRIQFNVTTIQGGLNSSVTLNTNYTPIGGVNAGEGVFHVEENVGSNETVSLEVPPERAENSSSYDDNTTHVDSPEVEPYSDIESEIYGDNTVVIGDVIGMASSDIDTNPAGFETVSDGNQVSNEIGSKDVEYGEIMERDSEAQEIEDANAVHLKNSTLTPESSQLSTIGTADLDETTPTKIKAKYCGKDPQKSCLTYAGCEPFFSMT